MVINSLKIEIAGLSDTTPSEFSVRVAEIYLCNRSAEDRHAIGQVLTGSQMTNRLVAEMIKVAPPSRLRIADLGAGTGILASSLAERVIQNFYVKDIEIDLVEVDKEVIPYLVITMDYLVLWAKNIGVNISYTIYEVDMICQSPLGNIFQPLKKNHYHYVVSNPPYFKIAKGMKISGDHASVLNGQPNAYGIFMSVAADIVDDSGVCGFITPQSFFNGNSFLKLRRKLFSKLNLVFLDISQKKKSEFLKESVLQKVCISCFRSGQRDEIVKLSYSDSEEDIRYLRQSEFIKDDIIYTPATGEEFNKWNRVMRYQHRIADFDLEVSTGSLVPHESHQLLSKEPTKIPLIWMRHIKEGVVEWPLDGFKREEYISNDSPTKKIYANSMYILLRRCAFAETHRHLYCTLFEGIEEYDKFSLENHVNYIHFRSDSFEPSLKRLILENLYRYLNSDEATVYFRSRCGNTQINVSDIRSLPVPNLLISSGDEHA